ncbi:heterokaryon incompatibility protein-domain-containing protein [Podospora australis]|uniref:Heterokaryon incompatibility protein-domain-containing protein n=1 Tax=Podospora australis TaxID=1536484 RepID=A0AAN6WKS3_9PEZI|nr:heterokaryon incompatibility protein-domain-containing protein [Podospora australis]
MLQTPFTITESRLIRQWLDGCIGDHPQCHSHNQSPTLPTRVIDVGSETMEPFLHVSSGENAPFVALSHCWGDPKNRPMITTMATLDTHTKCIPLATFPPTFRDAILVTRMLGVRYIWVDSLCIIQDSTEDWELESAAMTAIYHDAILTISADAAPDSTHGLFGPVGSRKFPDNIPVQLDEDGNGSVFVRERPWHPIHASEMFHTSKLQKEGPLFNRAWVLQEWLLSRRIARFASGELFWECNAAICCECQVQTQALSGDSHQLSQLPWALRPYSKAHFFSLQGNGNKEPKLLWPVVVEEFTLRNITKVEDRLPAVSGLAASMTKDPGLYLCGHWRSELPGSLLWQRSTETLSEEPSRRISPDYAPTWSWASITGIVVCGPSNTTQQSRWMVSESMLTCTVVEAKMTLATTNPFGPAASGHLKIKGFFGVLPVDWITRYCTLASQHLELLGKDKISLGSGDIITDTNDKLPVFDRSMKVYYLVIGESRVSDDPEALNGLLLTEKSNDIHRTFERVATFCLWRWRPRWQVEPFLSRTFVHTVTIV